MSPAKIAWIGFLRRSLVRRRNSLRKARRLACGFARIPGAVFTSTTIRAHIAGVGVPCRFAATATKWPHSRGGMPRAGAAPENLLHVARLLIFRPRIVAVRKHKTFGQRRGGVGARRKKRGGAR